MAFFDAGEVFWCLVGVGQGDDLGVGFALGFEQQSLAIKALKGAPAHGVYLIVAAMGYRAIGEIAEFRRGARVLRADYFREALAIVFDGFGVGRWSFRITVPMPLASFDGCLSCAQQVALNAGDHKLGEVPTLGQELGIGQMHGWGHEYTLPFLPCSLRNRKVEGNVLCGRWPDVSE